MFGQRLFHHLRKPGQILARHRYSTPLFLLRETLRAFRLHNGFSISASLSFYAMFALIPMALLIFFLLSHLVVSSSYATVKLAILISNLVPQFSHRIMIEVYNLSKHKAVWGVFGMFALFWAVTPLAGAVRSAFHTIVSARETHSLLGRMLKDALAVLSMLLLFFLFAASGLMLEKIVAFLHPPAAFPGIINTLTSLGLCTLMLAGFYRAFLPVSTTWRYILAGSLVTATLWIAMRPAFSLFLLLNQSYGTIFGGMKNMLISIAWLYYTFAVFLIGTELIATLHKRDMLLLKGLFTDDARNEIRYMAKLVHHFGRDYTRGERIFQAGDTADAMYYVVSGRIAIVLNGTIIREVTAGEHFGELAMLNADRRSTDAIVTSDRATLLALNAETMQALMTDQPGIAMTLLREMAGKLRHSQGLSGP